jgi:ABC-type antimicrobial peptide transport system permease subunit
VKTTTGVVRSDDDQPNSRNYKIFGISLVVNRVITVLGSSIALNIMIVSVTERTREIGVRALGLRKQQLLFSFIETLLIGQGRTRRYYFGI